VVTTYPDGLMDLNLSSKSWSMKLGKTTIFAGLNGEFGFGHELKKEDDRFTYKYAKHSFRFGSEGITYISKIEGIVTDNEKSNELVEVKEINTLKCQITIIRSLGILVGVTVAVLLAALLYLYLSAGAPLPLPV